MTIKFFVRESGHFDEQTVHIFIVLKIFPKGGGERKGKEEGVHVQGSANPTVMVIQQWSKQRFHPHHTGGVSPPWTHPLGFFFFCKFIGKMLNFSVKKRDYSLTS